MSSGCGVAKVRVRCWRQQSPKVTGRGRPARRQMPRRISGRRVPSVCARWRAMAGPLTAFNTSQLKAPYSS
eukprot:184267-Chlamydomonas_euryale.AAC.4